MIGLDTNVLVRYLTFDDPLQAAVAAKFLDSLSPEEPGFVSLVVLIELVWVLGSLYGFQKSEIEGVIETLLQSKDLTIDNADLVRDALRIFRASRAEFSDCVIERCANTAACSYTVTFDKRAAAAGMKLLH